MKYVFMVITLSLFSLSAYGSDKLNVIDTSWIFTPVLIMFLMGIPFMMFFYSSSSSNPNFSSALLVSSAVSAISSGLWLLVFYIIAVITSIFF